MATREKIYSDLAIPPGVMLAEEIEARGMSQRELAERTDRPEQAISEIINGKKAITAETALQLEKVLGVSSAFWTNLEARYQETLARINENEELQKQEAQLDNFPVREMKQRGPAPKHEGQARSVERTPQLLRLRLVRRPAQGAPGRRPRLSSDASRECVPGRPLCLDARRRDRRRGDQNTTLAARVASVPHSERFARSQPRPGTQLTPASSRSAPAPASRSSSPGSTRRAAPAVSRAGRRQIRR